MERENGTMNIICAVIAGLFGLRLLMAGKRYRAVRQIAYLCFGITFFSLTGVLHITSIVTWIAVAGQLAVMLCGVYELGKERKKAARFLLKQQETAIFRTA